MSNPFQIGDTVELKDGALWSIVWQGQHSIKDISDSRIRFGFSINWCHHSHFRLVKPGMISSMKNHKPVEADREFFRTASVSDIQAAGFSIGPSATESVQSDPDGLQAHKKGAKNDAGKMECGLILDFGLALRAVSEVATMGAVKYSRHGWLEVRDGERRYRDAGMRHLLARGTEECDSESHLPHLCHQAWNVLAELELYLRHKNTDHS